MPKKVTVLMTVYNGERYLKECIESVLNQSYGDMEFLIIDDASFDKSADMISSYKDDRIHIIRNTQNMGQVKSLNIGLNNAEGGYIARMDQDDIMEKNRIERQVRFFDSNKNIAVVGSFAKVIDDNGDIFLKSQFPTKWGEIIGTLIVGGYFLMHSAAMFKKDIILEIGKYDEDVFFAEDYDLWSRALLKGYKITNIPEFLMRFRYHPASSSKRFYDTQVDSARRSIFNFMEVIKGQDNDLDLDLIYNFLINAGLVSKDYWLNTTKDKYYFERITNQLGMFFKKIIEYFNLKGAEAYFMKKVVLNAILNFAYEGCYIKKDLGVNLYKYCLRNWFFILEKPKLYLAPIRGIS